MTSFGGAAAGEPGRQPVPAAAEGDRDPAHVGAALAAQRDRPLARRDLLEQQRHVGLGHAAHRVDQRLQHVRRLVVLGQVVQGRYGVHQAAPARRGRLELGPAQHLAEQLDRAERAGVEDAPGDLARTSMPVATSRAASSCTSGVVRSNLNEPVSVASAT